MKILSWNVAGLRSCIRKGFFDVMEELSPDIICLQEVKATMNEIEWQGRHDIYLNDAEKKGYSGVLVASKFSPTVVVAGFDPEEFNHEGRVIFQEYDKFFLICCYTPNSQELLKRLPYRLRWEERIREILVELDAVKPVIYCGDLNVAHEEIDIHNPAANIYSPGFSREERDAFTQLLSLGFVDTFRHFNPEKAAQYTYWSYRGRARERNKGWRLDYFVVSERLIPCVVSSEILSTVEGSDHCPIMLTLDDRML